MPEKQVAREIGLKEKQILSCMNSLLENSQECYSLPWCNNQIWLSFIICVILMCITLVFKVLNNVDVLKSFNYYFVQYTKFLLFFLLYFQIKKARGHDHLDFFF